MADDKITRLLEYLRSEKMSEDLILQVMNDIGKSTTYSHCCKTDGRFVFYFKPLNGAEFRTWYEGKNMQIKTGWNDESVKNDYEFDHSKVEKGHLVIYWRTVTGTKFRTWEDNGRGYAKLGWDDIPL